MPPHPSATPGKQVGWVVGAGARRAGRPGSRRGRKAPGRLPGRLLLWASAPPRLTSCRRCGKMLNEGSHRQHSQCCLAHGATKSPVVSRRPGFCCIRHPAPAALAASNAPNATKPLLFCCVHQELNKTPLYRYVNANKKTVLLRFAPERRPRLYSVSGQFTPPSNVVHPAYHGSAAHVNHPSCDSACDSMRRGFFFASGGVAGAAARRRGSRGGRNGPFGHGRPPRLPRLWAAAPSHRRPLYFASSCAAAIA